MPAKSIKIVRFERDWLERSKAAKQGWEKRKARKAGGAPEHLDS